MRTIDPWELEEDLYWDEAPAAEPIDSTDYAQPTNGLADEEVEEIEEDTGFNETEEVGEVFEKSGKPVGEAFEKEKLGSHRTASTA